MTTFQDEMRDWTARMNKFVEKNATVPKPKSHPRVTVLLTLPQGTEDYFKELAKQARQDADKSLNVLVPPDRQELARIFEKNNPPPKATL